MAVARDGGLRDRSWRPYSSKSHFADGRLERAREPPVGRAQAHFGNAGFNAWKNCGPETATRCCIGNPV
jgi:hypothetical protein